MTQRTAFTVGMQATWQKAAAVEQAFVYDFVVVVVVVGGAGVPVVLYLRDYRDICKSSKYSILTQPCT